MLSKTKTHIHTSDAPMLRAEKIVSALGFRGFVADKEKTVFQILDGYNRLDALASVTVAADKRDDVSEKIDADHPLQSGDWSFYNEAVELVSNRHSKYALVDLVNHLLLEGRRKESADRTHSPETGNTTATKHP